jgi:voltage-dependent potassium channel beta subunit
MKYRRLGNSGLRVSEIALGGWTTFGRSIQDKQLARDIITTAYDGGVNFFDIANVYAGGESERMMGEVLADFPRHTLVISTKAFWPMSDDVNDRGLSRKHLKESVEKSLKRIGTDYVDIFFCHRFDPETPLEETIRTIDDLIHQGKVLYWGTSVWTAAQIAEAVGIARRHNLYAPIAEQPNYSMLERESVEVHILPATEAQGMGLTVFSPLAQGILTGKYDEGIPAGARMEDAPDWMRYRLTEDNLERVRRLKPIADDLGLTRAQLALAWVLRQPGVSSAITGATRPEHVTDNLKAIEPELDEEALARIEEALDNAPAD